MNYLVWGLIACAGILIICWALASSKEEDTIAKNNQNTLSSIRADLGSLTKRVNDMNTRVYDNSKAQKDHERASKEDILALEKKLRDMEYDVLKPRHVNVHLPKGLTIKTDEPIKFVGGVRTKAVSSKKKVTKKKAAKKKTTRKKKSSRK